MRAIHKLNASEVSAFAKNGAPNKRLGDGGGLYVFNGSWVFIYTREGKRREMGLGPVRDVSLAAARAKAGSLRATLASGLDVLAEKREKERVASAERWTFKKCADAYFEGFKGQWKNDGSRTEFVRHVGYCEPIWNVGIGEVGVSEVKRVVAGVSGKPAVARHVLSVVRRVIDWAAAHGHRDADKRNPADVSVIGKVVAIGRRASAHHAAMPYAEVGEYVRGLRAVDSEVSRALEMIVLTGCRINEVSGMTWAEIDLDAALWTIPASRMKAKALHVVPLVSRAIEILERQRALSRDASGLVFRSRYGNRLNPSSFRYLDLKPYTTHGFRSSLRDYLGDETEHERETAEAILAHVVGGVEGAYRRGTALKKRRAALEEWARYIDGQEIKTRGN